MSVPLLKSVPTVGLQAMGRGITYSLIPRPTACYADGQALEISGHPVRRPTPSGSVHPFSSGWRSSHLTANEQVALGFMPLASA